MNTHRLAMLTETVVAQKQARWKTEHAESCYPVESFTFRHARALVVWPTGRIERLGFSGLIEEDR